MSYFFQSSGFDFPSKGRNITIGGWKELGRTSLGVGDDNITVSSLANKRYLMVLQHSIQSGVIGNLWRVNSDTGTNYAIRLSENGGADATATSAAAAGQGVTASANDTFATMYLSNSTPNEKLGISHFIGRNTIGATNAPAKSEGAFKWANSVDAVSAITGYNDQAGSFAAGSEVVVLGWDGADSHTTNFWEELASVNASGSSTNLSSGTITAKKYLWVQAWLKNTTSHTTALTFNNDTTTYAYRLSDNGGADATSTSQANISVYSAVTTPIFVNMFIINVSANEKLVIGHTVSQSTAGAATITDRREFVGKWDETASQITEIDLDSSSGNWDSASIIKVWGSD